ncbi:MAG: endolytic transglycosylase MltG [Rhodothermales bacterium]|nr:endolytic transglycosylase MltG [Rhodothermales bacterium]
MKLALRLLFIALALALLGAGAAYWLLFMPVTAEYEGFRGAKIPPGASFAQATDSLVASSVVDDRRRFEWAGTVTGWGRQLKPGYYRFEEGANTWEVLRKIRAGRQDPVRVTIPPGTRPDVMARVLRRYLDTDSAAFMEALRDPAFAAELGTDTTHLFGYLRPNTFDIYWTTDARGAIERLKGEWDRFWTDEMQQQADALGLTREEVLTLAAIVEWEARKREERPRIAGVYLNRLEQGWPLQADPTVQYALMRRDGGRMRRLLYADYDLDDPYNTYQRRGLPPGPITNPSESSIRAVLNAEDHDYFYFVADGTGAHVFSRTLAEHNRAAARYRELMRERRREQAQTAQPD